MGISQGRGSAGRRVPPGEAVQAFGLTCHNTATYKLCRGGGTGRRTGLKILGPARGVWVRCPPPAPSEAIVLKEAMATDALQIGELAERTGVSVDTIRHYERLSLLPKAARTTAGYRQYPPSAVDRVRLVRHALRFGFSLRDVAGFLRVRASGGTPCRDVRAAAERILTAVDQRIADLTAARKAMVQTLRSWDRRLARTPANRPARLLESLETVANHFPTRPPLSNLKTRP